MGTQPGRGDPDVAAFNAEPADRLRPALEACLAAPSWVEAVLDERPYPDLDALTGRVGELAAGLDDSELDAALARHPRIGAPPSGTSTEAQWSRTEQSGVDPTDADVQAALLEGNAAYEQRFGHVYLVRAAGRSSADILADLRRRLDNDPAVERGVVRTQLAQIAELRVVALVASLADAADAADGSEPR